MRFSRNLPKVLVFSNVHLTAVSILILRKFFLALYVYDGLQLSDSNEELDLVLSQLKDRFQVTTIQNPKFYVGLQIEPLHDGLIIFIHQSKNTNQIVNKFV